MSKYQQFGKNYMCKNCDSNMQKLWVFCGEFCEKMWVEFINIFTVGKSYQFFTNLPTIFSQRFFTHQPLLVYINSPVSTTPTATTYYIKGGDK